MSQELEAAHARISEAEARAAQKEMDKEALLGVQEALRAQIEREVRHSIDLAPPQHHRPCILPSLDLTPRLSLG